jgi:hypothetical protein
MENEDLDNYVFYQHAKFELEIPHIRAYAKSKKKIDVEVLIFCIVHHHRC